MIKNDLDSISRWFEVNKLTVNPTKSNVLIIPPKLRQTIPPINITLNNIPISHNNCVRYLEVILDSNLKFDFHITYI